MLSLLLTKLSLAGRAPHLLMNAPREKVSTPLWPVTNFISFAYNGAPCPAGRPIGS